MNQAATIQHFSLEWSSETGTRQVVARIYKGSRRTSAYVPVPAGKWDGNVPLETWVKAQDMYREDDEREF